MDRAILEERLRQAAQRVALGERHISDQRARADYLDRCGYDSAAARTLLDLFEKGQQQHIVARDRAMSQLGKNLPPRFEASTSTLHELGNLMVAAHFCLRQLRGQQRTDELEGVVRDGLAVCEKSMAAFQEIQKSVRSVTKLS